MKLNKTLLNTLSLIILALPIVYADEYEELKGYFDDKDVYIGYCEENTDGKVSEMYIHFCSNNIYYFFFLFSIYD